MTSSRPLSQSLRSSLSLPSSSSAIFPALPIPVALFSTIHLSTPSYSFSSFPSPSASSFLSLSRSHSPSHSLPSIFIFSSRSFSSSSSSSSTSSSQPDFSKWDELSEKGLKLFSEGKFLDSAHQLRLSFDEATKQTQKIPPNVASPFLGMAYANLGLALHALGKADDAIKNFGMAVRLTRAFDIWTTSQQERSTFQDKYPVDVSPGALGRIHRNYGVVLEEVGRTNEALAHCYAASQLFAVERNDLQRKSFDKNAHLYAKSLGVTEEKATETLKQQAKDMLKEQCSATFGVGFLHEQLAIHSTETSFRHEHQEKADHFYRLCESLTSHAFGPQSLNMAHLYAQWGNLLVSHWKSPLPNVGPAAMRLALEVVAEDSQDSDARSEHGKRGADMLQKAFLMYKHHDPKHPQLKHILHSYLQAQFGNSKEVKDAFEAIMKEVEEEAEKKEKEKN